MFNIFAKEMGVVRILMLIFTYKISRAFKN